MRVEPGTYAAVEVALIGAGVDRRDAPRLARVAVDSGLVEIVDREGDLHWSDLADLRRRLAEAEAAVAQSRRDVVDRIGELQRKRAA